MREYLVVMIVAWVATYLTTGLIRVAAVKFGALTAVRDRDVHTVPTPRLGGVGMYIGFLVALLVAGHLPMLRSWVFDDTLAIHGLLWGSAILILLGIADDRWGVDAVIKLAGQTLAASAMVLSGVQISLLPIPGLGTIVLDPTSAAVLSIVLVVVMINAVNFVDGLDGLAGGIAAIAALTFFIYAYRLQIGYDLSTIAPGAMVAAIVFGVCLGFLCHNWDPARIFMGDSGSMLLGLLLAATTILTCGDLDIDQVVAAAGNGTTATHKLLPALYLALVLPFTCLALPLADMVMATVRRTRAGLSPFAADKQHMHHRLLQIGHSKRRAVLVMYFWAALISGAVIMFSVAPSRRPVIFGLMVLILLGMVILLLPRVRRRMDGRAARAAAAPAPAAAASAPDSAPDFAHSAAPSLPAAPPEGR
jgi:UDP-GlcNAc:undecaprenyl-phosphate/decaprenyl-phosphate GlcNAc-1-phosphate transferase